MKQQIIITSLEDITHAAQSFLHKMEGHKKFAFYAAMGYGKTTFIKSICSQLGVKQGVSSPTYGLINEYLLKNDYIYHIDLYRLNSLEEALEIGIENYLFNEHYCFIEWPQIIESILPETFKKVEIQVNKSESRIIYF